MRLLLVHPSALMYSEISCGSSPSGLSGSLRPRVRPGMRSAWWISRYCPTPTSRASWRAGDRRQPMSTPGRDAAPRPGRDACSESA
jgi:hypothetical protein